VVQGFRPAVAAPPTSQIPGLGRHPDDVDGTSDAAHSALRDTDSAYVRLARQGGQRNLLSMEPDDPKGNSASVSASRYNPAPQTKPEWFYDNTGYHNNNAASGSPFQHSLTQYQASAQQ